MNKPILSIIIPCYNSENTLEVTLDSVIKQEFQEWEAIIVNDGSPDNLEFIALEYVKRDSRFKYFKKENEGLGFTRNFGIKKAQGTYILPLDSDNLVRPTFAMNAIPLFKDDQSIGVVYGNAMYIGERKGLWEVGDFDAYKMLENNYIDACAIIRKSLFDDLGFYDENIPYQGYEDWEFWIRVIASKYSFYYLKDITFDYRINSTSMLRSFDKEMKKENIKYIKTKHFALYLEHYNSLNFKYQQLRKKVDNNFFFKIKKKLFK